MTQLLSRIGSLLHHLRHRALRAFQRSRSPAAPPKLESSPLASRLDQILQETKDEAIQARERTSQVATRMQEVIDHADATRPLLPYFTGADIEPLVSLWDGVRGQVIFVRSSLDGITADSDLVSGTVSLTSASTSTIIVPRAFRFEGNPHFQGAWDHYVQVTNRPNLNDEVMRLIRSFSLDQPRPGEKSCYELFQTAHAAFSSPVSSSIPVSTSLIPMRECIQAAIDELLRRRPDQVPTGRSEREKVKSVARQLRRPGVSDEIVDEWADQWYEINNKKLSGSKRAQLTRDEWTIRLNAATRFLHSLLTGLDPSKLRS